MKNPDKLFQNIVLKDKNGTLICRSYTLLRQRYFTLLLTNLFTNQQFEISHVVRGPKKSYASKAVYLKK